MTMDGVKYASTIKKAYFTTDGFRTDTIVSHKKNTKSVEVIIYLSSILTTYQVCVPKTLW